MIFYFDFVSSTKVRIALFPSANIVWATDATTCIVNLKYSILETKKINRSLFKFKRNELGSKYNIISFYFEKKMFVYCSDENFKQQFNKDIYY